MRIWYSSMPSRLICFRQIKIRSEILGPVRHCSLCLKVVMIVATKQVTCYGLHTDKLSIFYYQNADVLSDNGFVGSKLGIISSIYVRVTSGYWSHPMVAPKEGNGYDNNFWRYVHIRANCCNPFEMAGPTGTSLPPKEITFIMTWIPNPWVYVGCDYSSMPTPSALGYRARMNNNFPHFIWM